MHISIQIDKKDNLLSISELNITFDIVILYHILKTHSLVKLNILKHFDWR